MSGGESLERGMYVCDEVYSKAKAKQTTSQLHCKEKEYLPCRWDWNPQHTAF